MGPGRGIFAMNTIHFSPKEATILNHRLEIPDCIAEVWGPDNDDVWPGSSLEQVEQRTERLIADLFTDTINGGLDLTFNPVDEDHVRLVKELLDGSSFSGFVYDMLQFDSGEPEYKEGTGWKKAMMSIETKLAGAGVEAHFNL